MHSSIFRLTTPAICIALSLIACKRRDPPTLPAASPPQAATVVAPTPVIATPALAPATPVVETPFNFDTIPDHAGPIPPFPYVAYPPKLDEAFQSTRELPTDEAFVILGKSLHKVEGRIATRTFTNRHADMSALELRRNYENALKDMGAVKVNTVTQEDKALIAANGDEYDMRTRKLRIPELNMSYDTYLVRKGTAHHWVVLMLGDNTTRVMSIEELPFVQTVTYAGQPGQAVTATGTPAAAPQPLDIAALPVNTAPLPPFPLLAYPPKVDAAFQSSQNSNFDAASFIVGNQLRSVEGRLATLTFDNRHADMGEAALRRNYAAALKGLGAVKVNAVAPEDTALIAANGDEFTMCTKKLRLPDRGMSYESYLVRTPDKNVWLALMFNDTKTSIVAVEEKAMQQSVALVTADTMRTELAAKGHIALYINFDTDQATIRTDGKPVVDEIAALLKKDGALKLSIEGHTDNSGDARHNLTLSRQRADAVVQALVGNGIDHGRLQAAGRGDATPVADNKDEAGRAKNRRVELVKI